MVAIMAAHHIWNHGNPRRANFGQVKVEFRDAWDRQHTRYYWYTNVKESTDKCELVMDINYDGSCTITVRRNSPTEGAEFELKHSQQHASGLREYFKMYKTQASGDHINSLKYGSIKAVLDHDTHITFDNEVRNPYNPAQFTKFHCDVSIV